MTDSVALAALIVSLVALFTTTGQLLQQYFATADGYRRCRYSVMGLWAKRTKRRWIWGEFRFETAFFIPRITYGPLHGDVGTKKEAVGGRCSLVNNEDSLEASMTLGGWGSPSARKYYDSDELVCWVPLLAQLHKQGEDIVRYFPQGSDSLANDTMVPVVQFVHKTWDFMPTDVVRPMASSTVSDVAIMARRMGQVWRTFDPAAGSMRAEGNGHVITSTLARSLGTILQYTSTSRENAGNCFYIPVKEADKLGFGLVEFDHKLFGPEMGGDLDVGSYEGISQTLYLLVGGASGRDTSKGMERSLRHILKAISSGKNFIPGFNDLVPICSSMLSNRTGIQKNRWLNRIPSPNLFSRGVTSSAEGFRVFERRLESFIRSKEDQASAQSKRILSYLKKIRNDFGTRWEVEKDWDQWNSLGFGDALARNTSDQEKAGKDLIMEYHTEMTNFLLQSRVHYRELVIEHILSATDAPLSEPPPWPEDSEYARAGFDPEIVGSMESYFDKLTAVVTMVLRRHRHSYKNDPLIHGEIEDAWFSMIFRAFCWQRSHVMIPGVPPLPSEYWNSKMPVYIG